MATLLGRLAQFGTFLSQGEVLCTQGLTYLLRQYPEARSELSRELTARSGVILDDDLSWAAEQKQDDGGRVDLEARLREMPVVKVEAKLTAAFAPGQLHSYAADLAKRLSGRDGILVVLVPASRTKAAAGTVKEAIGVDAPGQWRANVDAQQAIAIVVVSWEEVVTVLSGVESPRFRSELEQFEGMYRELTSTYIAPLTSLDELVDWPNHQDVFVKLVDQTTKRLSATGKILPMGMEALEEEQPAEDRQGYNRRYVCPPTPNHRATCYSVGVRHPFNGSISPVWMRFHKETPSFRDVWSHLESSQFASSIVRSSGHVWLPLEVPLDTEGEQIVSHLVTQVEAIWKAAITQ